MIIDIHVHLAGTGSASSCFLSRRLRRTATFWYLRYMAKHLTRPLSDESMRALLVGAIKESKLVDKAVLLPLDMVHDEQGQARPERTHLFVPNDYCAAIARDEDKVLFGASVHPNRPDALEELERVASLGAVLVKWIPSSLAVDPANTRYIPYYRKLAELGLPLLCHAGPEHAIPPGADTRAQRRTAKTFDHPQGLHLPLEQGTTVIAAHCSLPIYPWERDDTDAFFQLMLRHDNCFADISALFLPSPYRLRRVRRVLDELPHERLVLGSDYPLPVSTRMIRGRAPADPQSLGLAKKASNNLDRTVLMARAMGFSESVLSNAARVLRLNHA
ncbi:MAG: hypothetical protein D6E12_17770 [Desulfovibrio sp.]|nr:MAG: hypothetical protein D6E12_17770 [Desulfovibrio sp.]